MHLGGSGGDWDILLTDCVGDSDPDDPSELTLSIDSSTQFEPVVDVGTAVGLRLLYDPIYDPAEVSFTLRTEPEGTLLLAGIRGPSIGGIPYDPLGVELVSIGCNAHDDPQQCGLIERRGFELTLDDEVVVVSDDNVGSIGQSPRYDAIVGRAQVYQPAPTCDDAPPAYLWALLSLAPGG